MLAFVAVAKRPLSLMELREAIAIQPDQTCFQRSHLVNDVDRMIPWCCNLLILDEEEGLVQFAHYTIKLFLLRMRQDAIHCLSDFNINFTSTEIEMAHSCCVYLQFTDFERQLVSQSRMSIEPKTLARGVISANSSPIVAKSWLALEKSWSSRRIGDSPRAWNRLQSLSQGNTPVLKEKLQDQYKFLAYASEYWLAHAVNLDISSGDAGRRFCTLVSQDHLFAAKPWTAKEWAEIGSPVRHYIVRHKHLAVAQQLQQEQESSTTSRSPSVLLDYLIYLLKHSSAELLDKLPLAWENWESHFMLLYQNALKGGHIDNIMWLLVHCRVAVKIMHPRETAQTKRYNVAIAQLWEKGQNRPIFDIALRMSLDQGPIEALNLLLTVQEADNTVKTRADRGYQELRHAVSIGNAKRVSRLLAVNVDPNMMIGGGDVTAIIVKAAMAGSAEVVKLLLAAGANANVSAEPFGCTALYVAAMCGRAQVVRCLLDLTDVDINKARTSGGRTAIMVAAKNDHIEVVSQLLKAGADPQIYDERGMVTASWKDITCSNPEAIDIISRARFWRQKETEISISNK